MQRPRGAATEVVGVPAARGHTSHLGDERVRDQSDSVHLARRRAVVGSGHFVPWARGRTALSTVLGPPESPGRGTGRRCRGAVSSSSIAVATVWTQVRGRHARTCRGTSRRETALPALWAQLVEPMSHPAIMDTTKAKTGACSWSRTRTPAHPPTAAAPASGSGPRLGQRRPCYFNSPCPTTFEVFRLEPTRDRDL